MVRKIDWKRWTLLAGLVILTLAGGLIIVFAWAAPATVLAQEPVDVRILDPSTDLDTITVNSGDDFTMVVRLDGGVDKQLDGASTFVNFDPTVLTVVGEADGIDVTVPFGWLLLAKSVDNNLGHVDVSASNLFGSPVESALDFFTISLRGIGVATGGSTLDFETVDPFRKTAVMLVIDSTPTDVTGTLYPGTVVVDERPTEATFTTTPESGDEGSSVTFDGSASTSASGDLTYAWDFGDGNLGAGAIVDHIYADNGVYAVTLMVTDDAGGTDDATADITVLNVGPTVDAGAHQTVDEGQTVFLDPSTFSDPGFDCPTCVPATFENFIAAIEWGDGAAQDKSVDETPGSEGIPTTGTVSGSHVYTSNGIFTVTLTVTDDDGGSNSDTLQVSVATVTRVVGGNVRLEGRTDHSGVMVTFSGQGPVFTSSEGSFQITVPLGTYTVNVEMASFLTATKTGLVVAQDMTLPRVRLLGGDVFLEGVIDAKDYLIVKKNRGRTESNWP